MTSLTVNERPVRYKMDPDTPLLWALRDASNLTGTKYGCGTGECGACIVDIDGEAIRACLVTIKEAEGRFVTTIEGLSRDRSHPVQQAMVAMGAIQCGFCTPGIVMAAQALLKDNPAPADADIDAAITNICRCGVYPRLRDAIKQAGRNMQNNALEKNNALEQNNARVSAAPPPGITPDDAAKAVPALTVVK
jgi:isoquinoline 1-oxidoreductase subunit alpha